MKTIFPPLLFLSFISLSVNAQKFHIGFTAGPAFSDNTRETIKFVNLSNNKNDRTRTTNGIFSYYGGITASVKMSDRFDFRPEVFYMRKGWNNKLDYVSDEVADINPKLRINTLDVPLNFTYKIISKNGVFFLGLGPVFSYAFSGHIYDQKNVPDEELTFDESDTTKKSINRYDIGVNAIAGYEFRNRFFLSLAYYNGFRDIRTNLEDAPGANYSNKNRSIRLGIGYMF